MNSPGLRARILLIAGSVFLFGIFAAVGVSGYFLHDRLLHSQLSRTQAIAKATLDLLAPSSGGDR